LTFQIIEAGRNRRRNELYERRRLSDSVEESDGTSCLDQNERVNLGDLPLPNATRSLGGLAWAKDRRGPEVIEGQRDLIGEVGTAKLGCSQMVKPGFDCC
jgi:hypothetical protein